MKAKRSRALIPCFAIFLFTVFGFTPTAWSEPPDRTESPYFLVHSEDPDVDPLPLKATDVTVDISGVIADVTVKQIYENRGSTPLEAIYIFPASTRAAVYGMKMTIGERTVTAVIKRNEEARREYEAAKNAGQTASLLEQHRPNVFQMNVANILPKDQITVELKYTELLIPTDRVYEFVYPTVVGPRYNGDPAANSGKSNPWVANPYLHQGEASPSTFHMEIELNGGMAVSDMACRSHKVKVEYQGVNAARISLDESESNAGNRDFILNYRLSGNQVRSGLLLNKGDKENFFLMMIQPPKTIQTDEIPPREYVFIVDVSGSMHGFPLDITKELLKDLIGNLRSTDRFNVLLFSGGSSMLESESVPATSANIRQAVSFIDQQQGGGGTNLLPALKTAFNMKSEKGFSRTLVVVTDGYVTVEEEAFDLIRNRLGEANLFAFGIGSSVNRYLIEGMARAGFGEPFVITMPEEAEKTAGDFRKMIQTPVLTDVQVDFGDFEVYDVEPRHIPDVLADRPITVFGKWRGEPAGSIRVKGSGGKKAFSETVAVHSVKPDTGSKGLSYLWARHRIAILGDTDQLNSTDERKETITRLGLDYHLLTAFTSFVAVDTEIRVVNGKTVTVNQPLPMPQGVSDYAVGGNAHFPGQGATMTKGLAFSAPSDATMAYEARRQEIETLVEEKADQNKSRLLHVKVSSGWIEAEVREILEKFLEEADDCPAESSISGKTIDMILKINAGGGIVDVTLIVAGEKMESIGTCLKGKIESLVFPSQNGKSGVIKATLQMVTG